MQKDGLKISGYLGKYYVIDERIFQGRKLYLLESETLGDETPCLIVNENFDVVMDDVLNGFSDYLERNGN